MGLLDVQRKVSWKRASYANRVPSCGNCKAWKDYANLYDHFGKCLETQKTTDIKKHCVRWCEAKPAAFVLNMCGSVLLHLFLNGMYIYEKPTTKKKRIKRCVVSSERK